MKGVAIEHWNSKKRVEVNDWLLKYYGKPGENTWYIDYDFDLVNLILNDEIYTMFALRWP